MKEEETPESTEPALAVDWSAFVVPEMEPPSAEITKINSYGEITVGFSQAMMVPANMTVINSEILQFTVLTNNDLYNTETVIVYWEIIQFNEKFMKVRIEFTDSMLISSTSDLDSIELTFL